jgi:hypothetical protein
VVNDEPLNRHGLLRHEDCADVETGLGEDVLAWAKKQAPDVWHSHMT